MKTPVSNPAFRASLLRCTRIAFLWAALMGALHTPRASAGQGDCGQPLSSGSNPVASDCLHVLRSGVGSADCETCVCDTNGNESISASDALQCLRFAVGQPVELTCPPCEVCVGPFAATEATFEEIFLERLDQEGNFEPEPSCVGETTLCCPGGVPSSPCGPLHLDLTDLTFQHSPANSRVDLTMFLGVTTVSDLPVTLPLVGQCGLKIDTAPGASTTVRLDVPLHLAQNGVEVLSVGDPVLSNLTGNDVALTGGLACQLANLGVDFFIAQLNSLLAEELKYFDGACLGHIE